MNRRDFMKAVGIGIAGLGLVGSAEATSPPSKSKFSYFPKYPKEFLEPCSDFGISGKGSVIIVGRPETHNTPQPMIDERSYTGSFPIRYISQSEIMKEIAKK